MHCTCFKDIYLNQNMNFKISKWLYTAVSAQCIVVIVLSIYKFYLDRVDLVTYMGVTIEPEIILS